MLFMAQAYATENAITDDMKGKSGANVRLDEGMVETPYGGIGRYENLILRSEEFDNGSWGSKNQVTVTADNTAAPNGATTADAITPAGGATDTYVMQIFTPSAVTSYTFSIWLKSATGGNVSAAIYAYNDTPVWGSVGSTGCTVTTSWQRFSLTFTPANTGTHKVSIGGNGSLVVGENIYAWGAQLEQSSTLGVYAKTVSGIVTASRGIVSTGDFLMPSLKLSGGTITDTTGTVTVGSNLASTGNLQVTGSGPHYISNGSVAIGKTNPSAKLDVKGELRISNPSGEGGDYDNYPVRIISYYDGNAMKMIGNSGKEIMGVYNYNNLVLGQGYGNVGIGTAGPSEKLHIYQSSGEAHIEVESGNSNAALFINAVTAAYPYIRFSQGGTGQFEIGKVASDGNFYFNNNTAVGETNAAMIISNGGNVGIGTTGPGAKLQVDTATIGNGEIRINASGAEGAVGYYTSGDDWVAGVGGWGNSNDFTIGQITGTSAAKLLIEKDTGNVGIGTTGPGANLHVNSSTGSVIKITGSDANSQQLQFGGTTNPTQAYLYSWYNNGAPYFAIYNNNAERVRIDSTGNVGIGTTGPLTKLHTASANTTSQSVIAVTDSAGNSGSGVALWSGWSGGTPNQPAIIWSAGEDLRIGGGITNFGGGTGFAQYMVIKDGGNVGIGTTTVLAKLNVNGSYLGYDGITLKNGAAGNNTAILSWTGTDNGNMYLYNGGNAGVYLVASGDSYITGGNVGIGQASPGALLDLGTSAGAKFALYRSGNTKYGMGIGSYEYQLFYPNDGSGHLSIGTMSTSDGTTFAEKVRIDNQGFVGIGTASPEAKLDVANGTLRVGTAGDVNIAHDLYFEDTTSSAIKSYGPLTIQSGNPNSNYNLVLKGSGTGKVYVDDDLEITGTTTFPSGLTVASGNITASSGNISASAGSGTFATLTVTGNTNLATTSGNVGIGTTDPAGVRLRVNGILAPSGDAVNNLGGAASRFANVYATSYYAGNSSYNLNIGRTSADIFIQGSTGNVGIGTTNPTAKLTISVSNNVPHSSATGLAVTAGASGANLLSVTNTTYHNWLPYADGSNYYSAQNHIFRNETHATEWMRITSGGNVGIGTAAPVYKLSAYGTGTSIFSAGNATNSGGWSHVFSLQDGGGIMMVKEGGDTGTTADRRIYLYQSLANGSRIGMYDASGNIKNYISSYESSYFNGGSIGIGTAAPGAKLDVFGGSIRTDSQLISTAATGSAPLAVSSTTVVNNLNADLLDGISSGGFAKRAGYSASISTDGWYRIATNGPVTDGGSGGDRASATFTVRDTKSGNHSAVTFMASVNYGSNPTLTLLNRSYYSTQAITKIRLVEGDTYEGASVEVYINAGGTATDLSYTMYDNEQSSGWTAANWTAGSIPTGFAATQIDMDSYLPVFATAASSNNNAFYIQQSGAAFTGANKYWHAGNDGSTSTLDADLLDGQNGSYYLDAPSEATVEGYIANDVSTNYVPRDNGTKLVTGTIYDNGTNVGIGTTSPGYHLHLEKAVAGQYTSLRLANSNQANDIVDTVRLQFTPDSRQYNMANIVVGKTEADYSAGGSQSAYMALNLTTDGTGAEIMRLSGGNVGIGTTSPSKNLHVSSASGDPTILVETTRTDNAGALIQFKKAQTGLTATWSAGTGILTDSNAFTITEVAPSAGTRLTILSGGNVGIGTTGPDVTLSVFGNIASNVPAKLRNTNTAGYSGLDIFNEGGTLAGSLWIAGSTASASNNRNAVTLASRVSGEKVHIVAGGYDPTVSGGITVSAGNVGIGTTGPGSTLHVTGGVLFQGAGYGFGLERNSNNSADYSMGFKKSRGTYAAKTIVNDADLIGDINFYGYDGANYVPAALIDTYVTGAPGTNDMPGTLRLSTTPDGASVPIVGLSLSPAGLVSITQNLVVSGTGNTTIAGNIGIGTTVPGYKLTVQGSGEEILSVTDGTDRIGMGIYSGGAIIGSQTAGKPLYLEAANAIKMTIQSDGNVGIGTTAPEGKLHIGFSAGGNPTYRGKIIIDDINIASSEAVGGLEFKSDNWTNGYGWKITSIDPDAVAYGVNNMPLVFASRQNSATWSDKFVIQQSGNVGIGTIDPSAYKLNVNGNTNITGTLTTTGAINGQTIGASSALNALTVGGGYGSSGITMDSSGNLQVDGNIYLKGQVWKENATELYVKNNSIILNDQGSAQNAYLKVYNTNGLFTWNNASTRWEFGTAVANNHLYVYGNGVVTGTSDLENTISNASANNSGRIYVGDDFQVTGSSYLAATSLSGGLSLNNNNITGINAVTIDDPGSSEGLGWNGAASGWVIDVSPEDRSNNDGNLNLYGTSNNIVLWRPAKLKGTGSNLLVEGTGTSYISGSVGIGTTNPQAKLDINGSIKVASGLSPNYANLMPSIVLKRTNQIINSIYEGTDFTGWSNQTPTYLTRSNTTPANGFSGTVLRWDASGGAQNQRDWASSGAHSTDFILNHIYRISFKYRSAGPFNIHDRDTNIVTIPANTGTAKFFTYDYTKTADTWVTPRLLVYLGDSAVCAWLEMDELLVEDISNPSYSPALYADSSGNIGIGTAGPNSKLEVSGSTTPGIFVASTNYPTTYRTQLGAQSGAQGILVLGNNGVNEIRFGTSAVGGAGYFYVNNTADYSATVNGTLALTMAGNGTSDFKFNPTVNSNLIWHAGNDGSTSGLDADTLDSHDTSYFMTAATDNWVNTTGDTMTNRLIFNQQGDYLHIGYEDTGWQGFIGLNTYHNGTNWVQATTGYSGTGSVLIMDNNYNFTYNSSGGGVGNTVAPLSRLYIQGSSGNVGIGTTAPDKKLRIWTNDGDGLAVTGSNSNTVFLEENNGYASLRYDGASLRMGANGYNDLVTMTSGGKVGIGTTNPGQLLTINGAATSGSASTYQTKITDGTRTLSLGSTATAGEIQTTGGVPLYINPAGNNVVFFANTAGNVGIGTTSPGALLSLGTSLHTIKVASYDAGNSFYGMGTLSGLLTFGAGISSPDATAQMVLKSDGNVGIGTTGPLSKLHINQDPGDTNQPGGTDAHTALFINGTGNAVNEKIGIAFGNWVNYSQGGIYSLLDDASGSYLTGDITFDMRKLNTDVALTEMMRITHEGYIGIGTTLPTAKLEVAGPLKVTSAGDIGVAQDLIMTNIDASTIKSYGPLTVQSGGSNDNYNLTLKGTGTGKVYIDDDLEITGTTTFPSGLTVASGNITASSGNISASAGSGTFATLTVTGATNLATTSGSVGIGAGTAGLLEARKDQNTGTMMYLTNNDTGTSHYAEFQMRDTGGATVVGHSYNYSSSDWLGGWIYSNQGPLHIKNTTADQPIYFYTAGQTNPANIRMTILSSGNVGIGTTGPATLLYVGRNNISDAHVTIEGQSYAGVTIKSGAYTTAALEQYTSDEGSLWLNKTGTTKIMLRANGDSYINSGNVGIGTTVPGAKLHVENTIQVGGNGTNGIINVPYSLSINIDSDNNGAGEAFDIANNKIGIDNNNILVRVQENGNVGIGATGPTSPLHIIKTGGATTTPNTALILDYESDTTSMAGGGTAIEFRGKSSGGNLANYQQARIRSVSYNSNNAHGIAFDYKPDAGTALTEGMRLDNSANLSVVGIVSASGGNSTNWNTAYGWGNHASAGYDTTNDSWTGTGTVYTTSGNVGIGTTAPVSRLQISGTLNGGSADARGEIIDLTLQTSGANGLTHTGLSVTPTFNTTSSNVANAYGIKISPNHTGTYTTTNAYGLYVDATTVTSGVLSNSYAAVFNGGNVGIGTTAPQSLLMVKGGSSNGMIRLVPSAADGEATIGFYRDTVGTTYTTRWVAGVAGWGNTGKFTIGYNAGPMLIIDTSGNVGIGTTGSSGKLDIKTPYETSKWAFIVNQSGSSPMTAALHDEVLIQRDDVAALKIVDIGDSNALGLSAGDGNSTISSVNTLRFFVNGNMSGNPYSGMSGTQAMHIKADGNVGIGTAGPVAKLQSSGAAITTAPTLGSAAGGGFYLTNTDPTYGLLAGVAGSGNAWLQAQRTDSAATAYNLILQPSGGYVGIGTTGPSAPLEIAKGDGDVFMMFNQTSESKWSIGLEDGNTPMPQEAFVISNNTTLDATPRFLINSGGNVGIGTVEPITGAKLDVRGPIVGYSAGGFINDNDDFGTVNLGARLTGDSTFLGVINKQGHQAMAWNIINSSDASNRGVPTLYDKYDGSWHAGLSQKNGSVGIGTTNPATKLEVAGTVNATGSQLITNGTFDSNISGWTDNSGTVSDIQWSSSNGGCIYLYGAPDWANADQSISTVPGTKYVFTAKLINVSGTYINLYVGTTLGNNDLVNAAPTVAGLYQYYFTATSTTTWIRLRSGWNDYIDDVSVNPISIVTGGYVGIGTASPKGKFQVGATHLFGEKGVSVSSTAGTVLTLSVPTHQGCFVKVYVTGDWSSHSAVSYSAGFHVQNGDGGYSQPGTVAYEYANISTNDNIKGQVTGSAGTFNIQLMTIDGGDGFTATSTFSGTMTYEVEGSFSSVN